jgi:hypothetical protein
MLRPPFGLVRKRASTEAAVRISTLVDRDVELEDLRSRRHANEPTAVRAFA